MEWFHFANDGTIIWLPELPIICAIGLLIVLEIFLKKRVRTIARWISCIALVLAVLHTVQAMSITEPILLWSGKYRIDQFANIVKLLLLLGAILVLGLSFGQGKQAAHEKGRFYFAAFLLSLLGGTVLASAADGITWLAGAEMLLLGIYQMAFSSTKQKQQAMQWVVLGVVSSALLLFGFSFLFGLSSSTGFGAMVYALSGKGEWTIPLTTSFWLISAAVNLKLATVVIYVRTIDLEKLSLAAWLSIGIPAALLSGLFRLAYSLYGLPNLMPKLLQDDAAWLLIIASTVWTIGGCCQLIGQKRANGLLAGLVCLLIGSLLVPLWAGYPATSLLHFSTYAYTLVAQMLMIAGLLGAYWLLKGKANGELTVLKGLYYRAPWTSAAVLLLMLSLAGFPLSAGFFGKLLLVLAAIQSHHLGMGIVLVSAQLVLLAMAFGGLRHLFMDYDPTETQVQMKPIQGAFIWLCAGVGLLLGLFPQLMLGWTGQLFSVTRDLFFLRF